MVGWVDRGTLTISFLLGMIHVPNVDKFWCFEAILMKWQPICTVVVAICKVNDATERKSRMSGHELVRWKERK